jgi:hypothetical protein
LSTLSSPRILDSALSSHISSLLKCVFEISTIKIIRLQAPSLFFFSALLSPCHPDSTLYNPISFLSSAPLSPHHLGSTLSSPIYISYWARFEPSLLNDWPFLDLISPLSLISFSCLQAYYIKSLMRLYVVSIVKGGATAIIYFWVISHNLLFSL